MEVSLNTGPLQNAVSSPPKRFPWCLPDASGQSRASGVPLAEDFFRAKGERNGGGSIAMGVPPYGGLMMVYAD